MLSQKTEKSLHQANSSKIKKPEISEGLRLAQECASLALDKKAEDVLILDVSKLTSFTDYFVICSAPSERQAHAIARQILDEVKQGGKSPLGVEGLEQGHWILADLGDVIVHVFLDSARHYYDLEGFWADADRIPMPKDQSKRVASARA